MRQIGVVALVLGMMLGGCKDNPTDGGADASDDDGREQDASSPDSGESDASGGDAAGGDAATDSGNGATDAGDDATHNSGNGGGSNHADASGPSSVHGINQAHFQSDPGDIAGRTGTYDYTDANAIISVTNDNPYNRNVYVDIDGDERWFGAFATKASATELSVGHYEHGEFDVSTGESSLALPAGAFFVGRDGLPCRTARGSLDIHAIEYEAGVVTALDVEFVQYCDGSSAALRGQIRWRAADHTQNHPVTPPPIDLWRPEPGATPSTGRFVYLVSEAGDPAGDALDELHIWHYDRHDSVPAHDGVLTATYTQANAVLSLSTGAEAFTIQVTGDQRWVGKFVWIRGLQQLEAGYYGELKGTPSVHNPAKGAFSWMSPTTGCSGGWFVIDQVSYANSKITALDLRFEQRCAGAAGALHGSIHWTPEDTTVPPGPVNPPPGDLWDLPADMTPSSGNYVYLKSDSGDPLGQGETFVYTEANATLVNTEANTSFPYTQTQTLFAPSTEQGKRLSVSAYGDIGVYDEHYWTGSFVGPSYQRLQPGYYSGLLRYFRHNEVKGGLDWAREDHHCLAVRGWFAIDNVTYLSNVSDVITALDLRFEQFCDDGTAALHGKIRWRKADSLPPAGPMNPPPSGLWEPANGTTPANGRYVYLESGPGDPLGEGQTFTYTQANASFVLNGPTGSLNLSVAGDDSWSGNFWAPLGAEQLQLGYYAAQAGPARAGIDWSRTFPFGWPGCTGGVATAWFAVDSISYVGDTLSAFDVRFEQQCAGAANPLHGKIHWSADDSTMPPGPVNPPPSGLWNPDPTDTPSTGSYLYLKSEPGDAVGGGATQSYSLDQSDLATYLLVDGMLAVSTHGWSGTFAPMRTLDRVEPGYYGDLLLTTHMNTAKGGLSWNVFGNSCGTASGWFVVDSVTYDDDRVSALELRFEQRCDGNAAALHGKIHLAP